MSKWQLLKDILWPVDDLGEEEEPVEFAFGAPLKDCRVCTECDYVFVGANVCPKCGSSFMPLSRWLKSKDS